MLTPRPLAVTLTLLGTLLVPAPSVAQERLFPVGGGDADLYDDHPVDQGITGLLHALQRLGTVASVLHVTGHPDDEQSGMLTRMARGHGVRTSLLSLNRGEGGANAIGPELFDGLGTIRTEELLLSGRWYGLSALYFTTAVDYGYSKTLDEALRSWSREHLLEDMVRVIRTERPLVVVSRWYGAAERDGHGHHQAAGVLTPEAVAAAADPGRFPGQLTREGLRPWRALGVYRGRVREDEAPDVSLETTVYSPLLGRSFQEFASAGLSLQRSQTAGRVRRSTGEVRYYYERVGPGADPPVGPSRASGPAVASEPSGGEPAAESIPFFQGVDTSLEGVFVLTGEAAPAASTRALARAADFIRRARAELDMTSPSGIVADLVAAAGALQEARSAAADAPDARFILDREIAEVAEAVRLAAGISVTATADDAEGRPVHRVSSGQRMVVDVSAKSATEVARLQEVSLQAPRGWIVERPDEARRTEANGSTFSVTVGPPSSSPGPYFQRADIREAFYSVSDSSAIHAPWREPAVHAAATFDVAGARFMWTAPVRSEEPDLPRGVPLRLLQVVPSASVAIEPAVRVLPGSESSEPLDFRVTVSRRAGSSGGGRVRLDVPSGWRVVPSHHPAPGLAAGESADVAFRVWPPEGIGPRGGTGRRSDDGPRGGDGPRAGDTYAIRALLETEDGVLDQTEQRIVHADLEPRSLFTPAEATVRFTPLVVQPGVRVAYVMGVGDAVPEAIRELGATVELLSDGDLRAETLNRYDALVIGTRAYAVRPGLTTANPDILAFARGGGHVVVLYQTPEFDAGTVAPYAAELPGNAEEVSEEDAPVRLLAPDHPLLSIPNRITSSDFDDWVEQRGSKFFTRWGPEFTPLVETNDTGQAPQRGIWLTAPVGEGHWTYIALALHRQTPYGVPGAYRILANLLSYGGS